jgi:hypothetical protein
MRPTGLTAFISENRFRLTLGGCILLLAAMLALIQVSVGLGPSWASG